MAAHNAELNHAWKVGEDLAKSLEHPNRAAAEAIKHFADDKSSPALRQQELHAATVGLIKEHILPSVQFEDSSHHKMEAFRVAGTSTDHKDLVIAAGKENGGRAAEKMILGNDGKYYEAIADTKHSGYLRGHEIGDGSVKALEEHYKFGTKTEVTSTREISRPNGSLTMKSDDHGLTEVVLKDKYGQSEHLIRKDSVWKSVDSKGVEHDGPLNVIPGKDKSLVIQNANGTSRTILENGKEVNEDAQHRVTSILRTDGKMVKMFYTGNSTDVSSFILPGDGKNPAQLWKPSATCSDVFTVNGNSIPTDGSAFMLFNMKLNPHDGSFKLTTESADPKLNAKTYNYAN